LAKTDQSDIRYDSFRLVCIIAHYRLKEEEKMLIKILKLVPKISKGICRTEEHIEKELINELSSNFDMEMNQKEKNQITVHSN
jgi:hypothetical protein